MPIFRRKRAFTEVAAVAGNSLMQSTSRGGANPIKGWFDPRTENSLDSRGPGCFLCLATSFCDVGSRQALSLIRPAFRVNFQDTPFPSATL